MANGKNNEKNSDSGALLRLTRNIGISQERGKSVANTVESASIPRGRIFKTAPAPTCRIADPRV